MRVLQYPIIENPPGNPALALREATWRPRLLLTATLAFALLLPGISTGWAGDDASTKAATAGELRQLKKSCLAKVARAEVLRDRANGGVWHAHDAKGRRFLLFRYKKSCTVLPIGRAAARAKAKFGERGQKLKAFVIRQCRDVADETDMDDIVCDLALAIREPSGAMLDAVLLGVAPDHPALGRVSWFPGKQEQILVTGWYDSFQEVGLAEQTFEVYRVEDGRLRRLARGLGSIAESHDEVCSKNREKLTLYPHAFSLVKRGKKPVVQLTRPLHTGEFKDEDDPYAKVHQANGASQVSRLRYRGGKQRFVADKGTKPARVKGRDRCGFPE